MFQFFLNFVLQHPGTDFKNNILNVWSRWNSISKLSWITSPPAASILKREYPKNIAQKVSWKPLNSSKRHMTCSLPPTFKNLLLILVCYSLKKLNELHNSLPKQAKTYVLRLEKSSSALKKNPQLNFFATFFTLLYIVWTIHRSRMWFTLHIFFFVFSRPHHKFIGAYAFA